MKRIITILLIILLTIPFTGCSNQNNNTENNESIPVSYREELEKIIIKETDNELYYNGYAEYGHVLYVMETEEKPELTIINMEGTMMDGKGEEPAQRNFRVEYVVDDNSIREIIQNYDMYKTDGNMETVNSIIPNQIILQGPLEEGNLWFQNFMYNGKEYSAQTTLTSISENEEGKKIYKTETIVKDIEGFYNDTYTETRTYEEGKGLVSFQNNRPVTMSENDGSEVSEDDFIFGYGLSSIREVEGTKESNQ